MRRETKVGTSHSNDSALDPEACRECTRDKQEEFQY